VPKETFALEPALTELLVYIDKQNTQGRKPTFSDVEKAFSITGVTARKRINKLVNEGLVKVERSGRYKVLEVGEKGRQFLIQITT
jgi:Mn-dependent DtxR family transcriptional regulator